MFYTEFATVRICGLALIGKMNFLLADPSERILLRVEGFSFEHFTRF